MEIRSGMFTGLVQAVGRVSMVVARPKGVRLGVDVGGWGYGKKAAAGDSVCVAGVCLTLVERPRRGVFLFDVVQETLDKTRLGSLVVGDRVNLEHAATASTLMGGHIVQGHVDGVGRVAKVQDGDDWRVWIDLPKGAMGRDMAAALVSKGSVCVEGVSLTVAGLTAKGFWVALIPTTLAVTTLAALEAGDAVNLEMDLIAKMVAQAIEVQSSKFKVQGRSKAKSRGSASSRSRS
jgi:riboflavin synthase